MDKELDNIADDIIKESFGSAAPAELPKMPEEPSQNINQPSEPVPEPAPNKSSVINPASRDPFLNRPATPRETFTAEIPKKEILTTSAMPKMGGPARPRTNEYNRIKEQMSAAREASGLSNPLPVNEPNSPETTTSMPKQGLNKVVLLFIILIPVVVVVAGVIIALLNQPQETTTTNNNNNQSSSSSNQTKYTDPRDNAEKIDLSTYTSDIEITKPGYYILSGTTNFPIKVNASGEVTLYLHNISVTATNASALSNFSTNHLVIYLDDGTKSTLAVTDPNTFDSIYSEGDLTIDGGTGILEVTGIKIADGHHYDVTGNGIQNSKDSLPASETPTSETENPAESTIEQPSNGESGFQEGNEAPAAPSENIAPESAGPALN